MRDRERIGLRGAGDDASVAIKQVSAEAIKTLRWIRSHTGADISFSLLTKSLSFKLTREEK